MSDSRSIHPELVKDQRWDTCSTSSQLPEGYTPSLADQNASLVGQSPISVRAPEPECLTWNHTSPVQKDQFAEKMTAGFETLSSGPVSPVSPLNPSDALRTPNASERRQQQPSSPGTMSQLPPRVHSPASQIFERSVQEDILPQQASPSIAAHIRTENYIPPVLEASSAAITDEQLDPDSVEIVTHSLHQPAALGVTAISTAEQSLASSGIVDHTAMHSSDGDEMSSSHGALEQADVRRLSFISFADVVNAEHAETGESVFNRDLSQSGMAPGNPIFAGSHNRSPSPLQTPGSSHGLGTSPPSSIATSFKGLEMSPNHGGRRAGSPLPMAQSPVSSSFGGEFNVETMRQALRRTGSGDLSGITSQTASAVGHEETFDRLF
ncbi:hypothetical protein N7462_001507 [Penicillium macrosclerotiorum]|uniref:uncharacterized protein n=1 Tax=Penicillium macrosclerotiorum TaxID=303699 RepID=UPI0025479EED|nr:uncharacterized protein N7462_001507 [Penicillium macrosclerotiorum]KAJ5692084.1 hypothetical protein N7462_001507 [Penicillium macrosclerotiorum]